LEYPAEQYVFVRKKNWLKNSHFPILKKSVLKTMDALNIPGICIVKKRTDGGVLDKNIYLVLY
jgi:hypothetical protein